MEASSGVEALIFLCEVASLHRAACAQDRMCRPVHIRTHTRIHIHIHVHVHIHIHIHIYMQWILMAYTCIMMLLTLNKRGNGLEMPERVLTRWPDHEEHARAVLWSPSSGLGQGPIPSYKHVGIIPGISDQIKGARQRPG